MNLSDCFSNKCKKMRKHFSKLKFPTSKDSIDFKFNFYKTLKDLNFTKIVNISSSEFFYLKKFKVEKPFKIIDCDKNVGICLINTELYNRFVELNLNNHEVYQEINYDPLTEIKNNIQKTLKC